jgi:hypothetical protein
MAHGAALECPVVGTENKNSRLLIVLLRKQMSGQLLGESFDLSSSTLALDGKSLYNTIQAICLLVRSSQDEH